MELNIVNEVAALATPERRPTAATLRRTLRRNHQRQQPHLARAYSQKGAVGEGCG